MKRLTIIRHAQAESGGLAQRDIDRALSAQGQSDARQMAQVIAKLPPIDHILCSAAKRTRQTCQILGEQLNALPEPILSDAAYLSPVEMLQILLQNLPDAAQHAVVIGHNPGVENLVIQLCSLSGNRLNMGMATGTIVHLHIQIGAWTELDWGCGYLLAFVPPDIFAKGA